MWKEKAADDVYIDIDYNENYVSILYSRIHFCYSIIIKKISVNLLMFLNFYSLCSYFILKILNVCCSEIY